MRSLNRYRLNFTKQTSITSVLLHCLSAQNKKAASKYDKFRQDRTFR